MFWVLLGSVCVCVCFFFSYCDRCLKEEVGMAELGMGLIWMMGLEFWFFWVLHFFLLLLL